MLMARAFFTARERMKLLYALEQVAIVALVLFAICWFVAA